MREPDLLACYAALDLEPGVSVDEVRKAYLELAHVWDPNKHINNPPLRFIAEEKREKIEQAYRTLIAILPSPPTESAPAESVPSAVIATPASSQSWVKWIVISTIVVLVGLAAVLMFERAVTRVLPVQDQSTY